MLNCHKVIADADALLEGELSWQRRFTLRAHLLICRHCRRYLRQLRWLLRAIPLMHRRAAQRDVDKVLRRVRDSGRDADAPHEH